VAGTGPSYSSLGTEAYGAMMGEVAAEFPALKLIAASLREVRSASRNRWGGTCWAGGEVLSTAMAEDIEVLDRVGGGDGFASGLRVRLWLEQPPSAVVEPTQRHLGLLTGLLEGVGAGCNLVSDAHLGALALEQSATAVSYDNDFGRFKGAPPGDRRPSWPCPGSFGRAHMGHLVETGPLG
jgi:predicted nucleic acid-binding protein